MVKHDFYSYALDNENHLINAAEAEKGPDYFCPSCGEKMILRKGKQRRPHFAHKVNTKHCSYESYLHIIAKKQICKYFNESPVFMIEFYGKVLCSIPDCPLNLRRPCILKPNVQHVCNLKKYYDQCEEEIAIGGFRADLLISSKNKSNPPILIEIWVTHKSSESKLNSKYRIIEIHIESEDDIKQIINNASIVETDDMTKFYNFKRDSFEIPDDAHQLNKYQFWIDLEEKFHFNSKPLKCLTQNNGNTNYKFLIESSSKIGRSFAFYLLSKLKIGLKYCQMCRLYLMNAKSTNHICTSPIRIKPVECVSYLEIDYQHELDKINYPQNYKITIKK